MTKEKCKKVLDAIGLPRLIVFLFFLAIVITAAVNGIDVASYFSSTLKYWGMWGILVLAMVPSIKCGIGPYQAPKTDGGASAVSVDETLQAMQSLGVDVVVTEK